ncbi:hypothetical protein C2E23DRAFT_580732 [Lenzites betulinus]|nr:hypothetical protein C2E23DRAFT_580732 [Lenzites betulinus]
MSIHFEHNTCLRLRDATDAAVLAEQPVVRVLVLDQHPSGNGHTAFVWDGTSYANLALSAQLAPQIGDHASQLQVGSAMRIVRASRMPPDSPYPVLVEAFALEWGTDEDDMPLAGTFVADDGNSAGPTLEQQLQLVDNACKNEYRRRLRAERALRDVCAHDLQGEHFGGVVPAMVDLVNQLAAEADLA